MDKWEKGGDLLRERVVEKLEGSLKKMGGYLESYVGAFWIMEGGFLRWL